ncbi:MAG: hypothetical protein ACI35S_01215 [Anaeroplasma sp.]
MIKLTLTINCYNIEVKGCEIIMFEKLQNYLDQLVGSKLKDIKLACQMIILDFGNISIHCQQFTRVSKNDDILFTTLDYQSWDEKSDTNNDEKYFFDKYRDEIINGFVTKVTYNKFNDLTIIFDNGVVIESFVSNGYNHFVDEIEQWRLLIYTSTDDSKHIVVYNKRVDLE